ncbi:hypothetical protein LCGC14_1402090 [marine sediment metagenome]|uniref:HTH cro/C1-type domain-containing protein n=1 Tax=marine sediment metagenome TaxID=412755 RepID=A0A0F9KHS4_9ZZZZ
MKGRRHMKATATLDRRDDLAAEFRLRRLTVTEVARRCKISRQHLSDVLNGRDRLTSRLARDISRATKIPLATILPPQEEAPA